MKLSVVIGRFQTPYLHEGHKYVLDRAEEEGDGLLILVGVSHLKDVWIDGKLLNDVNFDTVRGRV